MRSIFFLPVFLLVACAGARPATSHPLVVREPSLVQPSSTDIELSGKNDAELQAIAAAAFAADDFSLAANAYTRIADLFPRSPHRPAALLQAALSYRALREWRTALERFRMTQRDGPPADATEAGFRAAECLYNLDDPAAALAELGTLAGRAGLEPALRIRAFDQKGILELETGDLESAQRSLAKAIGIFASVRDQERIDPHYAAEAMYHLGEIERQRFQALRLDPSQQSVDSLVDTLESKAQFLLAAQDRYLEAARMRDPEVIVASGSRIANLYDDLYTQMVQAPLPNGLNDSEQAIYRRDLNGWVRILVSKAIESYTETLAFAQRAGVSNSLVEATQASLERLQQALQEIDADPDVRLK